VRPRPSPSRTQRGPKGIGMTPDADYPTLSELITTKEGLEGVLGKPGPRVLAKVVNALDDMCLAFIARSPFVIVASHDAEGRVDVSPKGDPAGFAHVLDHRTIAIPERPGNLRADTFRNVLQQPRVGLIFLVPGKGETLRVSGTARIARRVAAGAVGRRGPRAGAGAGRDGRGGVHALYQVHGALADVAAAELEAGRARLDRRGDGCSW